MQRELFAVDLFSGGGGLTVGLKQVGFRVVGAIEIEPNAISTYKANHPEVTVIERDIRKVAGSELIALSPNKKIDLLAGCPPCQGFSTLTTKWKTFDPRNRLIREMGRVIQEAMPTAIMMENVPGLAGRGKNLFNPYIALLTKLGYVINWKVLQVADYGVPQNRRRLVMLAGKGFRIELPNPTHSSEGHDQLKQWRNLKDAIYGLPTPITLTKANEAGGPSKFNWNVIRTLSKTNILRLKNTNPGKSRAQLPKELRPNCHKELEKGFANVYGRMSWTQVSPTITGGATTLSKGRFGHPRQLRTISVREAALIQTFPQNYKFDTPYMDYACQIIGNALPCQFAASVAHSCREALLKESR